MSRLSEADRYLLQQIRQGDQGGWAQLVQRYQGRLVAFARRQLGNPSDADDAVQEAFIGFLTGLTRFRGQASIETYLFGILRRRIVDHIRGRGRDERFSACSLQDSLPLQHTGNEATVEATISANDPTASWYARQEEDRELQEEVLWFALGKFVEHLKESLNFRDLELCELIFYAQLRNKDIAAAMGMDEKQVGLQKHRFLKRICQHVESAPAQEGPSDESALADETMLTRVWESHRPSCPKRSTVGKYLLGTLVPQWREYVDFHINTLGCRFCRANLDDLDQQTRGAESTPGFDRVIQSTIGFLR